MDCITRWIVLNDRSQDIRLGILHKEYMDSEDVGMSFDFDKVFDRRHTGSLKWNKYKGRDVIPMWVADMDYKSPTPVLEALHKRVDHGIFGYTAPPDELVQVVVTRMWEMYQWKIEPSWIVWLPGVVPALHLACRAFGDDGDEVLTFTPVYPPFLTAPTLSRRWHCTADSNSSRPARQW